jgi:hypothetical protein
MGRVSCLCPFTPPQKNHLVWSFAQSELSLVFVPPTPNPGNSLDACLVRTIISSAVSSRCISASEQERDQRLDDNNMVMNGCEQGGKKGARDCGVWNDGPCSHGQGRQEGHEDLNF